MNRKRLTVELIILFVVIVLAAIVMLLMAKLAPITVVQ